MSKVPVIFLAFANDRQNPTKFLKNLPKEESLIRKALRPAEKEGLCELVIRQNVPLEEIIDVFQDSEYRDRIAIFHYGGHANSFQLLLETPGGGIEAIYAEGLIGIISRLKNLKLVFLNACATAPQGDMLIQHQIPAVIVTAGNVYDDIAVMASRRFYRGIGEGLTLEEAWEDAKGMIESITGSGNYRELYWEDKNHTASDEPPWMMKQTDDAQFSWALSEGLEIETNRDSNEGVYRDNLKNQFLTPIEDVDGEMTLQDIYIEPEFLIHRHCLNSGEPLLIEHIEQIKAEPFLSVNYEGTIHDYMPHFWEKNTPLNLNCADAQIMILLGYPGQGKTSFCKKLLFDLLVNEDFNKPVYWIQLNRIFKVKQLFEDPLHVLTEYLRENDKWYKGPLTKASLRQSILVLDGLNELYMKEGVKHSHINELFRILNQLTRSNDSLQIVITSRYGYLNISQLQLVRTRFLVVQLRPFNHKQQKSWLKKYLNFHPDTTLTVDDLDNINGSAETQFQPVRELISQPILLQMVARVGYKPDKNDTVTSIYDKLFETLIHNNAKHDNFSGLEKDDLFDCLSEIALAIYHNDHGYIQKDDVKRLPGMQKFQEKLGRTDLDNVLNSLMTIFFLREVQLEKEDRMEKEDRKQTENYGIEFLHKSLQDYLSACNIWNILSASFMEVEIVTKMNWNKVLKNVFELFAPKGLSKELLLFLNEIIEREDEELKLNLQDRMVHFLPQLLESNFWATDIMAERANPQALFAALNTFHGYWSVLSFLGLGESVIPENYKGEFTLLLKLLFAWKYKEIVISNEIVQSDVQARVQHQKPLFILSYQILSNEDLNGIIFNGIDLSFSDLAGSYINGSNLRYSILEGANLSWAELTRSNLTNINLEKAILNNTNFFQSDLSKASLIGATIFDANFMEAKLHQAKFSSSNLTRSIFRDADLYQADLQNTVLDKTIFTNARLIRAHLQKSRGEKVKFENADLQDTDLYEANLSRSVFRDAKLDGTNISSSIFDGADLTGTDLSRSKGIKVSFIGAILSRSNLYKANIKNSNMKDADLSEANLEQADLSSVVFEGANLREAILIGTIFTDADLYLARVHTPNWFDELENLDPKPIGIKKLQERYYIDAEEQIDEFEIPYFEIKRKEE